MDSFHRAKGIHLVYYSGIPIYYYLLGRRLLRLGHFPEWILQHRTY